VNDELNFLKCGHSSYWRTAITESCMACRAEKAEKRIAELEAALHHMAHMPEYDQDDAHRLRNLAEQALKGGAK
jgi:hypothetical protein